MGISPGSGHRPLTLEWGNLLSDQPLTAEHAGPGKGVRMNISLTRANCMRYNCRVIRAHSWKMQSCFVQAERVLDFQIIPEHHNCSSGIRQPGLRVKDGVDPGLIELNIQISDVQGFTVTQIRSLQYWFRYLLGVLFQQLQYSVASFPEHCIIMDMFKCKY